MDNKEFSPSGGWSPAWWGRVPGSSHEGDSTAGLVELPHVQLLVLLQGLLELVGGEATRDAALLGLGHADHASGAAAADHALCGELTDQREDDIGRSLGPGQEEGQYWLLDPGRTNLSADKEMSGGIQLCFYFKKGKFREFIIFWDKKVNKMQSPKTSNYFNGFRRNVAHPIDIKSPLEVFECCFQISLW